MDQPADFALDASTPLAQDLIRFYDEFLEFQAYSSLLCDAISSMAANQMELDEATRRGVEMFAGYLKRRVDDLVVVVKQLQEKSCKES